MPLNDFRSVYLPYCLKRQPDGRYVVLNREYKPLGFKTNDYVHYEQYPIAVMLKGLTPRVVAKISHEDSTDVTTIFLYNDGCVPTHSAVNMKAYLDRLAMLAKLAIAEKEH